MENNEKNGDILNLQGESINQDLYKSYHFFFHTSKAPLLIVNNHLEIVQMNKQAMRLFEEVVPNCTDSLLSSLLEQVPVGILRSQLELIRGTESYKDGWLLADRDNTYRQVEFEAQYDGQHYYFTLRDITGFKKQERDYMISTRLFKDLFTLVTEGMLVFDRNGRIVESNRAFMSFVFLNKSELKGRKFEEFLQVDSKRKWQNEWGVLKKIGKMSSTVEWTYGGKTIFFKCTTYMNVYKDQFICVLKDVTEKKLIELRLKSSQEIFSYVFEHVNEAIILTDRKGYIYEVNDVACRLFEAERIELLGTRAEDLVVRKEHTYAEMIQDFMEKGSVRKEIFFKTVKGKILLLEVSSKRIDDDGKAITIYRNISERYEVERKLKRSERQFRRIFEGMLDGLLIWDEESVADVNEVGLKILNNVTKDDIVGKPYQVIREKYPKYSEWMNQLKKYDRNSSQMFEDKLVVQLDDGTVRHVETLTKMNLLSSMHLTVLRDVTEKLVMQEQIRKSDTLNVVGELAAGIAHEIRNPMTALKGFIQLLEASVKGEYSTYFSIITSELKRIDSIITEFLVFAKPQAVQYVEKDLNEIVKETVGLLSGEALLNDVILVQELSEDPIMLFCEPNQLKQVMVNLTKNAIESMKDGGNVTIKTEISAEQQIHLTVKDEGCGISDAKLKRLGEPFYTTKDRGTGLGLMVSYKIIKEHGGNIDVRSKEGNGTTFSIKFSNQGE